MTALTERLLAYIQAKQDESSRRARRQMLFGDLVETLAAETGCPESDVEQLLTAGAHESQARCLLRASAEYHIHPMALWALHEQVTRAQ